MVDRDDTLPKLVSRSHVPVVQGLFDLVVKVIPIYKAQLHRSSLDVLQLTLCSKCLCPVSSGVWRPPVGGVAPCHRDIQYTWLWCYKPFNMNIPK